MRLMQHVQTKVALGGEATIGLIAPDSFDSTPLFAELWRQTFQFERQCSRFLPESELSRFNAQAGMKVPISNQLHALLATAQKLSTQTNGLMNPFVLPAIQRTGYVHSAVEQYAHDEAPDYTHRAVVDIEKLELELDWARIPYNSAIDIGGFGKGYLADQLGAYARTHEVAGYWINLSGDIALFGQTVEGSPMTVAVQNASTKSRESLVITCPSDTPCGIATSGTLRRTAHEATLNSHHIIDPRTGSSAATDLALVTVCADSALQADVLASCAVIVGSKNAPTFLKQNNSDNWVLQRRSKSGTKSQHHGARVHQLREASHG